MNLDKLKLEIRTIIEPVINALGIELDHIDLNRMGRKALLRVFIEKENGVSIDDCALVSREIEAVLDVEDPIPYSYVLEVSSPGLDRPLKNVEDFKKYSGRTIRVVTHGPIEKQTFFLGKLIEAGDAEIEVLLPNSRKVSIAYENISRARLEVEI
jgi:ribosome maturation factor RimP